MYVDGQFPTSDGYGQRSRLMEILFAPRDQSPEVQPAILPVSVSPIIANEPGSQTSAAAAGGALGGLLGKIDWTKLFTTDKKTTTTGGSSFGGDFGGGVGSGGTDTSGIGGADVDPGAFGGS